MKVVFSTNSVQARDRLEYWREEASRAYVPHEFTTSAGCSFEGTIRAGSLGGLDLATFECDECDVRRTAHCLRSDTDDDLILALQMAGHIALHQDGRNVLTRPNDIYLIDPRRSFSLGVHRGSHSLVVKAPRWEIEARLGDVTSLTARSISSSKPVTALAAEFLTGLAARANAVDGSAGPKLVQQALDLVALAFEAEGLGRGARLSSPRAATLLRLKAVIEAKLHDPTLKPVVAAEATGISVRYANALLAEEGTSLERFIVQRRLQQCRRLLENPAQACRTVADIAYSWGFSDAAHFTRRFRAEFGCSPSECRPRPK
jgi:AraC-like DNA-binding protein